MKNLFLNYFYYLSHSSSLEQIFWVSAILGTLFFFLRFLFGVTGLFGDGDIDHVDVDVDCDGMDHDFTDGADDGDDGIRFISMSTLTGFFMMFGWVGLACYKQFALAPWLALSGACAAGVITVFLSAYLAKGIMKLASPGSRFVIEKTKGMRASVYQKIPANGTGKIIIYVDGMTREVCAVAENKKKIDSFKKIEIVRVVDNQTVSVKEL